MKPTNKGEIRRLKGNLRYRVLIINEDYYFIDTGASPWKAISPFLFWIFRIPGYKIDKETALKLITNQKAKPGKSAMYGLVGGGLALTLSSILNPLVERLHINSTIPINTIITFLLVLFVIFTFLFILKKLKQSVKKTINYTELPSQEIRFYLPKLSHLIGITFASLISLSTSVISLLVFINYNNVFILCFGLVMLLIFLLLGGVALDHGKYKIKFK
jgi:uncharacterized membrane protein (TIGR01218 family)